MADEWGLLLPRVCAALADPRHSVSDDTCLEKLLDWILILTQYDLTESLLQDNPCLPDFLAAVVALPEPSPRILSFTLRLAGILAATKCHFQRLQQEQLLVRLFGRNGPLNSTLWEDASVRSGWVVGMHNMMHHQFALHFLCNGGGIDVLFTLQGDPSLFVASAASKLLVHVLTLSAASETTKPLNTVDSDCPTCAQMIIKHIEDSIQSSSASHVEQSLKLLANLIGSCSAPWTKVLWFIIAKPLESFLTEETFQAQHMLANLLLKMARSPVFSDNSGGFWSLVSSALERLTPVQAGPLAVGILSLYKCPQGVRMQALTLLLQPLDCILRAAFQPLEYAGLLDESVTDPTTVESLLSSRSSCVGFLCQTLTHLEQLLSRINLPVDLPYASLQRSVMAILQFCNGLLSPASPLGSTISRILINCSRVQKSALTVVVALLNQKGSSALTGDMFDVLLAYLESPNTSPTVLKKAFRATSKWLVRWPHLSCSNNQWQQSEMLEAVFPVLQKRLCSPSWEVRDSSLEFLIALIQNLQGKDEFRKSILSSEVPKLTESLLEDPESYVRASAVTAVGHLASITCFSPESPAEGNQYNKQNTVAKLQEILSTDSEGFPRRAVISIFNKWLAEGYMGRLEDTEQFVSRVIQTVERDLDWEVRLMGLELVEVFCSSVICQLDYPICSSARVSSAVTSSLHENELLRIICRAKLFGFLFQSLCDFDKPLGQRACQILLYLRDIFSADKILKESQGIEDSPAGHSIAWLQRTLRQGSLAWNFPTDGGNGVDFQDPESMMLALGMIDFEDLRYELNRCSDHMEKSPQSLLQDIIATVGTVEENEADCY